MGKLRDLLDTVKEQENKIASNTLVEEMDIPTGIVNFIESQGIMNFNQDIQTKLINCYRALIEKERKFNWQIESKVREQLLAYYEKMSYTIEMVERRVSPKGDIGYEYKVIFEDDSYVSGGYVIGNKYLSRLPLRRKTMNISCPYFPVTIERYKEIEKYVETELIKEGTSII